MAFAEEFAPYFADMGVAAVLDGAAVRGIYAAPYAEVLGGVGGNAEPTYTLASSAAATVSQASTLVISAGLGAGTWRVGDYRPDGTGITVLVLERP